MVGSIYRVPALEKGLDLLETLATFAVPLTLTDLAAAVGRGNNEIFRMVSCLEARGYLQRENGGGYRLTLKLHALAQKTEPLAELVRVAAPEMKLLSGETGESCHLGLLEGAELVVVHRNESPRPVRLAVEVGGRFPAIHTVSGRLLLSALGEEERDMVLEDDPAWQALEGTQRRKIADLIRSVARSGVSTAVSETVEGVADTAVGCGFPGTPLFAALAISRLSPARGKPDPLRFAAPLRRCAARIHKRLGRKHGKARRDSS
jgi:DNA-binding IclR family transcriptional regulator